MRAPDDPGVILEPDDDDPPPIVGYADVHWWFMNRFAEEMMRAARFFGLL